MSKHINVNPDHYKTAGRERQGENVVHQMEKRAVTRLRRQEKQRGQPQSGEGQISSQRRKPKPRPAAAGISNREPAEFEAHEREQHPPIDTSSPPPEDASGRTGEKPLEDRRDRQTSHKAGSRSIAQKEAGTRYPDRSMPASRKVAGAFGREPQPRPAEGSTKRQPAKHAESLTLP